MNAPTDGPTRQSALLKGDKRRSSDLSQGEHMLIWEFRAMAFGVGACPLVRKLYERTCAVIGSEALNALQVFVRELSRRGRRKVTLCVSGSYRLSRDEQLIVAIFDAVVPFRRAV